MWDQLRKSQDDLAGEVTGCGVIASPRHHPSEKGSPAGPSSSPGELMICPSSGAFFSSCWAWHVARGRPRSLSPPPTPTYPEWSGLRFGEATALRVGLVDPTRRRVRVEEAATEVGGRLIFGPPKNREPRTVIVPRYVMDALQPLLNDKTADDLVFTALRGGPVRLNNFRRRIFSPAAARIGVPDLVPHDLRDTAASLAISSGASIKAVQRMLGHASAKMTLDVYGSLFEEDLEALADRLEERYGGL
jgi:integrase